MLREHIGTRRAGRVFQSQCGTPLVSRDICRRALTPLCKRLGIDLGGMHAFRHGRFSHMQASMVPSDFATSQSGIEV
jgi:integrase